MNPFMKLRDHASMEPVVMVSKAASEHAAAETVPEPAAETGAATAAEAGLHSTVCSPYLSSTNSCAPSLASGATRISMTVTSPLESAESISSIGI